MYMCELLLLSYNLWRMVLEIRLLFYLNIDELDQKFLGRSHRNLLEVTETFTPILTNVPRNFNFNFK